MRVFRNRHDAGAQLARALHGFAEMADAIVVAHTFGSVPVAYEIAMRLALPLGLLAAVGGDVDPTRQVTDVRHDPGIADRVVLLTDDGDAARELPVAIAWLRAHAARSVVAAVAVASPQVHVALASAADQLICVLSPQHIYSAQAWYADFAPPSDDDVRCLCDAAARDLAGLQGRRISDPVG